MPSKINVADLFTKSVSKEVIDTLNPTLAGTVLTDWTAFKGRVRPDPTDKIPVVTS